MHITLCARSKILNLTEAGNFFRINVSSGSHIDLILNADVTLNDVTISSVPHIIADVSTVLKMVGRSIDYDYSTKEFVISNGSKE